MQELPVGIQSFVDLRGRGCVYVDKTRLIEWLINRGKTIFLSRPRRFGKSLLVSTLQALFEGRKDLFEGLYIADKVDWEQQYPVIKQDWSLITHTSAETIERASIAHLRELAASFDIALTQEFAADCFGELIQRLHQKTGKQVVVLVDEYDMPMLDALSEPPEIIEGIRKFLQNFYRVLKGADEHLRFVFMTGITKFAKVSVFSALNNLLDVTFDATYATLCGYTQEELESCFAPHLEELAVAHHCDVPEALAKIRRWYNGFSWDGENAVYNPFSTLVLLSQKKFTNLWFETGTPTFLVNLMKERNDVHLLLEPVLMKQAEYNSFDYRTLDTKQLFFQSGYLTIKKTEKDEFGEELVYTLGIPNEEVRQSLMDYLTSSYAVYPVDKTISLRGRMMEALLRGEAAVFETSLKALFANIPYQLHIKREAYYHSLLLLWLNMLGFHVDAEVSTSRGRIDAVWTWKERAVIAEVKYASKGALKTLLDTAMEQIKEKGYCDRYAATHQRVAQLAVVFSGKRIACRMKELSPH
ncbi:MAG: ATP-binding protein [Treponema sp.]|jgi:nicotinamide riboside kinase|nr:ATP-binding protein [Treponema sp.]